MDKNRLWAIGAILAMVAVIAGGWFLGIQPQLAMAATADQSRATTQAQNRVDETLLASLKTGYRTIGTLKTQLATLRSSVPEGAELSTFVTELDSLAAAHKATVSAIRVNDATAYTPPVSVAVPAPSATPAPTPSATATPSAPAAPVGAPQVSNPKITAANFVAIPVNLTITGQYADLLDFVNGLQTGPRLFLVTSLSIKTTATTVESSIGGFVYVLLPNGATTATIPAG